MDYLKIIKKLGKDRIKLAEPIAKHTTYRIGGPADLFYEAKTEEELVKAIKLARKLKIPYFILGGGSNVLVSDKGFRGLVIKIRNTQYVIRNTRIIAGAGLQLARVVQLTAENSLSGLEFAAGIPGTVGGAVRGNAGAWSQSVGERILRAKVLISDGRVKWIKGSNCQFAYRHSRFKESGEIILKAEFSLKLGDKEEIKKKIDENLKKRSGQPREPSLGCIFVNPKPDSAGRLIDEAGLKGKQIGQAQISPKHANFIVNLGGASCDDVLELIMLAKKEVKKKFGVDLKEEIEIIHENIKA